MVESNVRIVLLGKTGVGKSATGNTILGYNGFKEDDTFLSVTKESAKNEKEVSGKKILVADTPGLFDTKLSNDELKEEIAKCVRLTVPGPHVFLLVLRLDARFTAEEQNAMKWIEENFSKDALKYAMILFTRGDCLDEKKVKNRIDEAQDIRQLVEDCGGRYHVFNNKCRKQKQVTELLAKIERMVKENGGDHYTDQMYRDAQRKIEEGRNGHLITAGKVLVTAPAFVAGAALGLMQAVVDIPISMWTGGKETADELKRDGRFNDRTVENVANNTVDLVGGELKGVAREAARAPKKVLDRALDFVDYLWKS